MDDLWRKETIREKQGKKGKFYIKQRETRTKEGEKKVKAE